MREHANRLCLLGSDGHTLWLVANAEQDAVRLNYMVVLINVRMRLDSPSQHQRRPKPDGTSGT